MANDDDKKTSDAPEKPEGAEDAAAKAEAVAAKVAKAAAEEAVAEMKLAEAKAEDDADERQLKAEVAAAKAAEAKADAAAAKAEATEAGDESAEAAAEMTRSAAEKTRAEALEEAAEAEHEVTSQPPPPDSEPPGEPDEEEPDMRPSLFLAEYESADDLAHAAEQVRDAGYESWDCHTPYPVHGLDEAMGLSETKIGWISFVCGMVGLASAVLMIQYMNNWDYPIIIGGKPPGAFPSMVPIMFELTVLLCGFGTLFGLLHLIRLPRHHHPIFESDRFERVTDDRFFISIEVEDPKFDIAKTRALLEKTHPSHLELVEEEIA